MKSFLSFLYTQCVNFIWPPFCSYCKVFLDHRKIFCSSCFEKIKPVVSHQFFITKTKMIPVFALSGYKDPVRSLILKKHSSDIIASRQLGKLLWDMTYIKNIDFDIVVPVPLHWTRFANRGFNQAEEIAKVIAKESKKPLINLIKRTKKTVFQAPLGFQGRTDNVKDAFVYKFKNNDMYKNKKILLVDDLMTTGSTLKSSAKLLYRLKPKQIYAVVVARVI